MPCAMSCTRTSGRDQGPAGGCQPRRGPDAPDVSQDRASFVLGLPSPGGGRQPRSWRSRTRGGRERGRVCPAVTWLAAARVGGRPSPRIGRQHDGNDDTAVILALRADLTAESLHGALHAPQSKPARSAVVRRPPTEPCRDGRKIMLEDEVRFVTAAAILDEQAGPRPVGFERDGNFAIARRGVDGAGPALLP